METWRDRISVEDQADLDGLLNDSLGLAHFLLERHGEFFPAGMGVRLDGANGIIAPDPSLVGEHADSLAVVATLKQIFAAAKDDHRALALITDVHIAEIGSDAVQVLLEHRSGVAIRINAPYSIDPGTSAVTFAELLASPAEPSIWMTGPQ